MKNITPLESDQILLAEINSPINKTVDYKSNTSSKFLPNLINEN